MTKRAAIYCRISRDREGRELGVDRQEADCRALAGRLGLDVIEAFVEDDRSASTRSRKPRPEYARMIADARAGLFDTILAYTTSRLTRRPLEHEALIELSERHGVRFEFVASPSFDLNTAAGRRVARILAANDAGEAEDTAERVTRAKLQSATNGWWEGGRRPYGYEADGVTVRESEAREVRAAAEAVLAGRSLASLARDWNARGLRTSTGREWDYGSLRRVLIRTRNAGLMEHQGREVGRASWPAIVPEDTWRAVRAALTDPLRHTSPGNERRWLLSGLAVCGMCGAVVRASSVGTGTGGYRAAYRCRTAKHVARDARTLDQFVAAVVIERLSRPDAAELLSQDQRADTTELHVEAVAVRQRLTDLAGMYADGGIDARQLREGSERLRARLDDIERQIAHASRGSVLSPFAARDPAEVWAGLDLSQRRAVVNTLMTVTLHRARRGRVPGWRKGEPYFDPQSIEITPRHAGP